MYDAPPHRYIKVRAKTKARNEAVIQTADDSYHIAVKEAPQGNAANERITLLLAQILTIPLTSITLIKGHHHPSKTFIIR